MTIKVLDDLNLEMALKVITIFMSYYQTPDRICVNNHPPQHFVH